MGSMVVYYMDAVAVYINETFGKNKYFQGVS